MNEKFWDLKKSKQDSMINGEVVFNVEWASWPPAKHIIAEYRFIPDLISNALTGGGE